MKYMSQRTRRVRTATTEAAAMTTPTTMQNLYLHRE